MANQDHLYILWTNADPIVTEKMVFMYAINSLKKGWWEKVTLIIWGATAKLAAEDSMVKQKIGEALTEGMKISACKACADQLGVTEALENMGIEVIYWGNPLTDIIKSGQNLLTI
ncbi:MAG: DsrE family protein [Desulfomonilaceae bacterium]